METCGICEGPLFLLGTLGNLEWTQCRNCGMSFPDDTSWQFKVTQSVTSEDSRPEKSAT